MFIELLIFQKLSGAWIIINVSKEVDPGISIEYL